MSYHQSSAVSVAAVLTAATVIVVGYRLGRTPIQPPHPPPKNGLKHSAWRDVHNARQALRSTRRDALAHTIEFLTSTVLVLAMLFAAAYNAAR